MLRVASGVTAIIFDKPAVASIDVRGGGPGTRDDALLEPEATVEAIDAITLSGGSALGLDAARRRAGLARRTGPRPAHPRSGDPDRARRDLLRSAERRQQGLGTLPALSRSRLCRRLRGRHRFRARQRRRRAWRHHRQFQGRPWLGLRANRRRRHGGGARGGQCRRQRHGRRRAVVLGGAVRGRRRISADADCRRHSRRTC